MPTGLFGRRARLPDKQVFTPPPAPPTFPFPMAYEGPTLATPGMEVATPHVRIDPFGERDLPFASNDAPQDMGLFGPRRGLEPPTAPQPQTQAEMDNIAAQEAIARARRAIREEGVPIFNDPAYQQSGQAMAAAVDQSRAAEAEMERRQGVSWDQWWHHRGRQDPQNIPPLSLETYDLPRRYRWGPAPDPNQLSRQRPRPRPR